MYKAYRHIVPMKQCPKQEIDHNKGSIVSLATILGLTGGKSPGAIASFALTLIQPCLFKCFNCTNIVEVDNYVTLAHIKHEHCH